MPPWSSAESKGRVAGLATRAMLQLVVPKIRQHPLSFASRPTFRIGGKRPPRQGNRSRTVGDGQIISRFDSPAVIFSLSFSVGFSVGFSLSYMHCIRSW